MSGATVTINDSELKKTLTGLLRRLADMHPAMKIIGEVVRTSVVRNFEVGGRPEPWAPLSETTLAHRKGDKILVRQGFAGGLLGSINYQAADDHVIIGTNKVYAGMHQFGAEKGEFGKVSVKENVREHTRTRQGKSHTVRAHARNRSMQIPWGDVPARPFLMVQDEDWEEIKSELNDYLFIAKGE